MIYILPPDILTIWRKVIAGRRVDVAPTHQEQHIALPIGGGRRNDVSAAPRHVTRRTVPLLSPVGLKILQIVRVPFVEEQRLPGSRRHVISWHCIRTRQGVINAH